MADPFTILGVDEDAGDEEIRRAYLALVRAYPPDRAPEKFQAFREAYELLIDERKRLLVKLLQTNDSALARLMAAPLREAAPMRARASRRTVAALLNEGIMQAVQKT